MSTAPATRLNFDGYTVRPLTEQDRGYLELLIGEDKYHRGQMDANFFLRLQPGEDAWALEDERGEIVFYFRTSTAVRLAIQFRPVITPADRRRNAFAMMKGFAWIEALLRKNGFREMITDTEGPELRAFLKKNLGFNECSIIARTLEAPTAPPEQRNEGKDDAAPNNVTESHGKPSHNQAREAWVG